jgi:hypothetical protein
MTGFGTYLLDVPVCWCSKSQKGVMLSSTEAEYVAITEAVKKIRFVYYLLNDLHNKMKRLNVDIRYHFVREFIEDGFIKIEFARSADIFTKEC